jgi:DNA-binding response OmpR family regulator
MLRDNLELEGYDVALAADGEEGLKQALSLNPDLVLLDITLPRRNGYEICRELRNRARGIAIVMLTAHRMEGERVLGLDLGADDYITKPFSVLELLARVRAVLRRVALPNATEGYYRIGDLEIDFRAQRARRGKDEVIFTGMECAFLQFLVAHAGQTVTRDQILSDVWGYDESSLTTRRTIDNFVLKLRHKIEPSPHAPRHLLTVYGVGYKFVG